FLAASGCWHQYGSSASAYQGPFDIGLGAVGRNVQPRKEHSMSASPDYYPCENGQAIAGGVTY
ncbi:MAG: hypothetical protein ABSF48_26430, partial [Thermodesulfobacteriota bacterium]